MADADFGGVTNPKRVIEKRMAEAEDDGKKGKDMGDLPSSGSSMSQAQFSGYTKKDSNKAGLEKALKNRK